MLMHTARLVEIPAGAEIAAGREEDGAQKQKPGEKRGGAAAQV